MTALVPRNGDDRVYTPRPLADLVVAHFSPTGSVLEPCAGQMAFVSASMAWPSVTRVHWTEVDLGSDFFDWKTKVDWLITNPPWSKARKFAQHAYEVADNIVFLITLNHFTSLKARFRDMEQAGFGIRELALCPDPPPPWPQSGFQLGAIHIQRGYSGPWTVSKL